MSDVFISYSRADMQIAETLADELKARALDVWWDLELYAGQQFRQAIKSHIEAARAVIVIWSSTAAASQWVIDEANHAVRLGKLITTHTPNFNIHDIPYGFGSYQRVGTSDLPSVLRALSKHGPVLPRTSHGHPAAASPQDSPPDFESMGLHPLTMRRCITNACACLEFSSTHVSGFNKVWD